MNEGDHDEEVNVLCAERLVRLKMVPETQCIYSIVPVNEKLF